MDQTDSAPKQAPVPDANEGGKQRRSSIELKKIDAAELRDSANAPSTKYNRPEVIYKGEKEPGTWMFCLKCSLICLITFILVLGAAITGISIWMAADSSFWDIQLNLDVKIFGKGIYIGIAIGVFLLLVGLIGCIGSWKENTCLLLSFCIIIMVIVLLEITVMALIWTTTNNSEFRENLTSYIKQGISKRFEDDSVRNFVDFLQKKLKCCGVDNEQEYGENESYPDSCLDESTGFPYAQGCLDAAISYLKSKAGILGGISAAVFSLQILAFCLTVCLLCGLRQAKQDIF